jgi:hypothetical protein
MNRTAKISFYSSLIFTIYIVLLDVCYLVLFANPNPWISLDKYVANYKFIEVLPEVMGFVFLPLFLITISGIISNNNLEKTVTAKISIFFASAFVVIVSIGYFIQFAIVYPNIHTEGGKLYELWLFGNTNQSLAWGINYLGWFWGGICTLLIAFKIKDTAIKVLFASYGILLGIAFIGYCMRNEMLQIVLGLAWFVILPVSFLRVTLLFKKIFKGGAQYI